MEAKEAIDIGEKILSPILSKAGFSLEERSLGSGSGGPSAWLKYSLGDNKLECHYRFNSLLAIYNLNGEEFGHSDLIWAITKNDGNSEFPTFNLNAQKQFQALANDITNFTLQLFTMPMSEVTMIIEKAKNKPKGFSALI